MRLNSPFIRIILSIVTLYAMAVTAVEPLTPISRQLNLYYTLQQRIAQPGELSDDGVAGLQLLLAQLYSEMGMLLAAEKVLGELEGGPSILQLRDMGHLLLARQYRQRGELEIAQTQLAAIGGQLDAVLENERQQMLALSAVERGAIDEASRRYGQIQGGEGAVLLARFNYAALLLAGGGVEHGLMLLQELSVLSDNSPAVAALRDRANLLLGYYFLRQQGYQDAERFLRRVRLSGPYSRAALLALGWAELELRGPEYAMVPWMELLAGGHGDSLDEEAELAIAAAIASKGASQRAIEHYQRLIKQFEKGRTKVVAERQRHARAYAPQQVAAVLEAELEQQARNSVAAVALTRLLSLRQQLNSGAQGSQWGGLDENAFFERLWPLLHTLYPELDESSGIGVAAHVARRTESIIRSSLKSGVRSARRSTNLKARIEADRATLDGEIAVVAEWYRRSRVAALQARDERLGSYMEQARLAIARSHDLALRRQERE